MSLPLNRKEDLLSLKNLQMSARSATEHTVKNTIKTRKIAILAADGYDYTDVSQVMQALKAGGAHTHMISKHREC